MASGAARKEILSRIRRALADHPVAEPVSRDYDLTRAIPDVPELFAERVADYHAQVARIGPKQLPDTISDAVSRRKADTLVVPPDVPAAWCIAGVDWQVDDPPLPVQALDKVDGVLTGCAVAIAETGTIVLDTGVAQGRRALTLVPDYHLCVVFAEQVVGTVPEALALLNPERPLTFISGPSATSDIELNRIEGVHGPRTLEIVLVTAT